MQLPNGYLCVFTGFSEGEQQVEEADEITLKSSMGEASNSD